MSVRLDPRIRIQTRIEVDDEDEDEEVYEDGGLEEYEELVRYLSLTLVHGTTY